LTDISEELTAFIIMVIPDQATHRYNTEYNHLFSGSHGVEPYEI
jgi:hypothetical protein